jgi:hypothetical protein
MKITFVQYILLGVFGVFLCGLTMQKFLQSDFFPYKGHEKTVLLFTRDLSQEGHIYGPRVFTLWNLSHVLYYAIGAYLFPDKAMLLWLMGIVWEYFERYFCAFNFLDILWNTIGIFIGLSVASRT